MTDHTAPEPVIIREGAGLRTADELLLVFIDDAVSLGAVLSATGQADFEHLKTRLETDRDQHSGAAWFSHPDDQEGALTLAQQVEEDLCTVDWRTATESGRGYIVRWDDGYTIRPACRHRDCRRSGDQHEED